MKRNITVFVENEKYKFNADINTLEELKRELDNRKIEYSHKHIIEGISKTELKEGELPKNIVYQGRKTNDLIILIKSTPRPITFFV